MIETNRFYIRKYNIKDAADMFNNWVSDEEVTKYLTWNPHYSIDVTKEYIEFVISTNQANYVIVKKDNNEVIGSISTVGESADFKVCEIGYCLSKKYWNQGVMTEVLDAYLHELFINKNYQVVEAEHMIDNTASGAVMIKCGFCFNYICDRHTEKFGCVSVKHYSISKEMYLIRKQIVSLSNFLETKIPLFNNFHQEINYLQNNGFLVKTFNLIESNNLYLPNNDYVYNIKETKENILNISLIGNSNKKQEYEQYLNSFIAHNKDIIISDNSSSIEQKLVSMLKHNNLTISFAESCTGGLMASRIINVSGASDVIKESFVTYSNEAKIKYLYVKKSTIDKCSVYSKEVAYEMAKGLSNIAKANISVSITGLAGSDIPTANDGSYHACIIISYNNKEYIHEIFKNEKGSRNTVRSKQANYLFYRIIKSLREIGF